MRVLEMYDNLGSGNYGGINRMHVYGWLNDISAWIATYTRDAIMLYHNQITACDWPAYGTLNVTISRGGLYQMDGHYNLGFGIRWHVATLRCL